MTDALAQAKIGIAIRTCTHVSMEAGGFTLFDRRIYEVFFAGGASASQMRTVRQNLFFAFNYNAIRIPLATGIPFPVFGLLLNS